MTRAARLVAALLLLHPGAEERLARVHAEELLEAAREGGVDPLLLAAQAERESRWNPTVLGGRDGQCVGLMQICLHDRPACQGGFDTPACNAERARLQEGRQNLLTGAGMMKAWGKLCRRVTGVRAGTMNLLHGFGGFDRPGIVCGRRKVRGRNQWVNVKTVPPAVMKTLELFRRLHTHP